jgi:hypothetical protein
MTMERRGETGAEYTEPFLEENHTALLISPSGQLHIPHYLS